MQNNSRLIMWKINRISQLDEYIFYNRVINNEPVIIPLAYLNGLVRKRKKKMCKKLCLHKMQFKLCVAHFIINASSRYIPLGTLSYYLPSNK